MAGRRLAWKGTAGEDCDSGLRLVGHRSNRGAIGAEVGIVMADGNRWTTVDCRNLFVINR